MAIQKANKLRNVANVAKEILKDPTQTEREIADKLWIDRSTVNRAKDELYEDEEFLEKLKAYKEKANVLPEDFVSEIDCDLLDRFVSVQWSRFSAMKEIERFIRASIWDVRINRNISSSKRYDVLNAAWFKCQACWEKPNPENEVILHIDHIIPVSLWGSCERSNLQVLCSECNLSKSNGYSIRH